jgi:hypothetical protein
MSGNTIVAAGLPPYLRLFARSNRFRLVGRVGEGGMGTVYRVHDRELGQDVALKVMRRAGPTALQALKREFRSRAGLGHPNLVQLHDLITGDDFCGFSMELVEGVDFLGWVRPELARGPRRARGAGASPPSAEALVRLRDGLTQLVRGLRALHAGGLVHRDIKPANVLGTASGRIVIVDFGLAVELQEGLFPRGGLSSAAGTLPYMAPEQLQGAPLTPASDLYAVGLMLYEALTGLRPFQDETAYLLTGDEARLLHRRHCSPPSDPRALAPGIPDDLAELAMALLDFTPGNRPDAGTLLARLGREEGPWAGDTLLLPPRTRFVGRASELAVLDAALRESLDGHRQVTVRVHGPSGIGKSTLVREFLQRQDGLLVLKGRCHPQEAVAYRSLDPVIDALASHLLQLGAADLAALVPAHAHAMVRLFPVLGRVSALREAPVPANLPVDVELRRLGAEALRELLRRLAERCPLVVWIDDAHWGDADSARLLAELLRSPGSPALLLVLSYRDADCGCADVYEAQLASDNIRRLGLGPLDEEDTRELARQFLVGGSGGPEALRSVAGRAGGNPFVVCEVSRYLASAAARGESPETLAPPDLARLLAGRLLALPPPQRALVELAAVAGVPLPQGVLLAGAGLGPGARPLLLELCDASLLRRACGERSERVTFYHDRTREVALAQLADGERAVRHRAVAEALEHVGSENLELLTHQWLGAGEPVRAGRYAVDAAARAAHVLAFEQAARLYAQALSLLGDAADRPALLERLGDALSNLGRKADAAARYLEAAEALGGGDAGQVRTLRRRAAEQSIKCGRVEEGWRVLRAVLGELDVPVPRTRRQALLGAGWNRLRFLQAHREPVARASSQVPPGERPRLEALWTAATSFAMVDHVLADAFRMRYLRRVLAVGEASSVCKALAFEVAMEAHLKGGWMERHAEKLLAQVERLARWTGDACDEGWWRLACATRAFTHGRWSEAVAACERGEFLLRQRCIGVTWELDMLAVYHHGALAMRGELRRLGERVERFLEDSTRRGDIFGILESCLGDSMLAWLARGQGERAWALARGALDELEKGSAGAEAWNDASRVGLGQRASYSVLTAVVHASLYAGQPWRAWREVQARWAGLYRATPSLRFYDAHVRHARARAALAAAEELGEGQSPPGDVDARWTRRALLADARAQARLIGRESLAMGAPVSALVRAGVARLEGDTDAARTLLAEALEGFEAADMALHREAARYALGALQAGEEGRALQARAEAWLEAQGVVDARALVATLAPGLGLRAG